ncbi:MAG TPA: polysaccharide biosynthesis tyrosine autokinase, partial [Candidatus Acidoferrum sp.]|nr:polysaccharide biosynthesis tyrosine autokinase [Candidatus Acidoferrum sp.]
MNHNEDHLNTKAVDLFSPANRFLSASKLYALLHRWWLLLRRYWRLPATIALAIIGLMYIYTAFTGPVYESQARMWVTGKLNVSQDYGYMEQLVDFLGTQGTLLQSPSLQRRALARLRGESRRNSDPAQADNVSTSIPFGVKVDQGAKSSTLDLRATGRDPVATRKFLDCLMAEYLSFKRESSDKASGQAASSLNDEAAQLKGELEAAQAELQDFQASNNVVFLQQEGSSAQNYLASLNRQLATLRTELKLLDSLKPEQWAETDAGQPPGDAPARPMPASLDQSQAALFQADQQMHLLMAQRNELSRFLRPAHPKILKLNQEIATEQEIVQASRDETAKQLALRRQALELQVANLEAASTEWDNKAIAASRKMADYDQIQQKVQRLQAADDKTFGLIQNVDVAQRVEQADIGILDPASVAKPTHRMLIHMAAAIALSLALGFGLLYGIALFQDYFVSHTELAEQLAEPVLGLIPSISMNAPAAARGIEGLEEQRFEFLEAIRTLRASLLFMKNGGPSPKVLVITSSVPEEGKSTVALYLAATLARGGSRVLLVDADMRRPSLHKFFGRPNAPGLAELLSLETASADVIVADGVENLAFLPAGKARRNPCDLMLSPAWETFLEVVRPQYDYIVVDTPPVAAADDAAALA